MNRIEILNKFKPARDNLLLIIHELHKTNPDNHISEEDMIEVAGYLNIPFSSVYGVVTYYSMFSRTPRGKFIIRVCNSPVCEMTGSEGILQELQRTLQIKPGETSSDKLFTLETTECIGRCDESPCLIINEHFSGNLNVKVIRDLINHFKSGEK